MFENEFHIAALIRSYLGGDITETDQEILEIWLDQKPENRQHFNQVYQASTLKEKLQVYKNINRASIWQQTMTKINRNGNTSGGQLRKLHLLIKLSTVAAIFTVFIGAGLFYYILKNKKESLDKSVYNNDIVPGKTGATLTLANGEKINLSNVMDGLVIKEADVSISKKSGGKLVYEIRPSAMHTPALNSLSTAKGETYQLRLPDGTLVYLNAASSLSYSTSLIQNGKRYVKLQGEAYFEVTKDKTHPFVVETSEQKIEVLGTEFNINSYHDEPGIVTTLIAGSVHVLPIKRGIGTNDVVLKPGEQSINKNGEIKIYKANVENSTDWKNDDFFLNRINFKTAMRKIARWYDVELIYDDSVSDSLESGGWISRKNNLSSVLKSIESSGQVHFKIEGRKVYISKQ